MEYIYGVEGQFSASITNKSRLVLMKRIKDKLSDKELSVFEKSCFGQFLRIAEIPSFQGQVLHFLSSSRIRIKLEHEVWFNINGKTCRFSINEFALISGLDCGDNIVAPEKIRYDRRLLDRHFNGRSRITIKDLEEKFFNMDKHEDRVKLALLLCLEGIVLGHEYDRNISCEHIGIANSLEVFNAHSWGRLSFELTLWSFKKRFDRMRTRLRDGQSWSYTLYGFPWAIQFWAYEAFPYIGQECAARVQNTYPRILNWISTSSPQYHKVSAYFRRCDVVHAMLIATEDERTQLYVHVFQYNERCCIVDRIVKMLHAPNAHDENVTFDNPDAAVAHNKGPELDNPDMVGATDAYDGPAANSREKIVGGVEERETNVIGATEWRRDRVVSHDRDEVCSASQSWLKSFFRDEFATMEMRIIEPIIQQQSRIEKLVMDRFDKLEQRVKKIEDFITRGECGDYVDIEHESELRPRDHTDDVRNTAPVQFDVNAVDTNSVHDRVDDEHPNVTPFGMDIDDGLGQSTPDTDDSLSDPSTPDTDDSLSGDSFTVTPSKEAIHTKNLPTDREPPRKQPRLGDDTTNPIII